MGSFILSASVETIDLLRLAEIKAGRFRTLKLKQNTCRKWFGKVFISIKFTSPYLALKLGYINKTYTQSRTENSLFQVCLPLTELFSPIYLEDMPCHFHVLLVR